MRERASQELFGRYSENESVSVIPMGPLPMGDEIMERSHEKISVK